MKSILKKILITLFFIGFFIIIFYYWKIAIPIFILFSVPVLIYFVFIDEEDYW